MNRTQAITFTVSGLVVAGLVALAVPAVGSTVDALSSWQKLDVAAVEPSHDPSEPTHEPSPLEQAGVDSLADEDLLADDESLPDEAAFRAWAEDEGLIYAGNGTAFSAEGPGNCATNAAIHPYGENDPRAKLGGELTDMGVSPVAQGEVGYNADGLIQTYTVEPGDTLIGIGERFCIDYVTVGAYNGRFGSAVIQPGDVLVLRP